MRKAICMMMALVLIASLSTAAWADGRRGHRSSRGSSRGGGVSDGAAIAIGVGSLFLGTIIGAAAANQQEQVQYVPVAPQYAPVPMQGYQQVPVQPPTFMRGTCFPQGGYFPNGVMITTMGYYPPGTMVQPGFCFQ